MRLLWTKSAKESYELINNDAPEIAEKVKSILKDTISHPDTGSGSPTKLEGDFSGLWQRTYGPCQVIIYKIDEQAVTIVSIGAKAYQLILEEFNLPPEKTKAMYAVHWDIGQTWR